MIIEYRGKRPKVAASAFVAPTAVLIGDVEVGEESSDLVRRRHSRRQRADPHRRAHERAGQLRRARERARDDDRSKTTCTIGHCVILEDCTHRTRRARRHERRRAQRRDGRRGERSSPPVRSSPPNAQIPPRVVIAGAPAVVKKAARRRRRRMGRVARARRVRRVVALVSAPRDRRRPRCTRTRRRTSLRNLPGLGAAVAVAAVAAFLARFAPLVGAPVLAIVLGVAVRALRPLPDALSAGDRVLRAHGAPERRSSCPASGFRSPSSCRPGSARSPSRSARSPSR